MGNVFSRENSCEYDIETVSKWCRRIMFAACLQLVSIGCLATYIMTVYLSSVHRNLPVSSWNGTLGNETEFKYYDYEEEEGIDTTFIEIGNEIPIFGAHLYIILFVLSVLGMIVSGLEIWGSWKVTRSIEFGHTPRSRMDILRILRGLELSDQQVRTIRIEENQVPQAVERIAMHVLRGAGRGRAV